MIGNRSFGLDVLRANAIAMVVSCHWGIIFSVWLGAAYPMRLAISGFFGVELFFVLSGFLIGRIVLDILRAGASVRAWRIFLVRRWMRTLPLYWTILLLLAVVWAPRIMPAGHRVWHDVLAYATLTQNLAWPMVAGWFSVSWSLSVEEWFYILFPTVLFAAAVVVGRRAALFAVIGVFLVLPAALRWHITTPAIWDGVVSKMVLCRLDAIGFGVAAAWATSLVRPARVRDVALLLLGVLLVAAQWSEWTRHVFTSESARGALMFDVVSAGFALCLPFAASWERCGVAVARAGVFWLSRLAYPLYLTHLSVLEMVGYYSGVWRLPAGVSIAVTVVGTGVLAWGLSRFIEQPVMGLRPKQGLLS